MRDALRKETVEPVFGIIKEALGFRRFHPRGLTKVNLEWTLVRLAYNIKRLYHIDRAAKSQEAAMALGLRKPCRCLAALNPPAWSVTRRSARRRPSVRIISSKTTALGSGLNFRQTARNQTSVRLPLRSQTTIPQPVVLPRFPLSKYWSETKN